MSARLTLLFGVLAMMATLAMVMMDRRAQRRVVRQVGDRLMKIAPSTVAAGAIMGSRGIAAPEHLAKLPTWLQVTMARADFVPNTASLCKWLGLAVLAALLLTWQLDWVAGIGGLLLGLAAGPLWLRVLARRRIIKLIDSLPFLFDGIRQMMMAGGSLQQALVRATDNADFAMRRYLDPVMRRMQNGASVGDSLAWQAERLNVAELHMLAVAVQASMQYGGRLSLVLANLAATLRDRTRVARELRSATAEMRVSAYVVGSLPIVSGIFMSLTNSGYATFFLYDPTGHTLLGVAVGMQLIGIIAMRHLMRLEY